MVGKLPTPQEKVYDFVLPTMPSHQYAIKQCSRVSPFPRLVVLVTPSAPNHQTDRYSEKIFNAAVAGKGKTQEAKARAKAEDKRITDMAIEIENMSPDAQNDYWNKLSHADKVKLLTKGKWDKGYFKRSK